MCVSWRFCWRPRSFQVWSSLSPYCGISAAPHGDSRRLVCSEQCLLHKLTTLYLHCKVNNYTHKLQPILCPNKWILWEHSYYFFIINGLKWFTISLLNKYIGVISVLLVISNFFNNKMIRFRINIDIGTVITLPDDNDFGLLSHDAYLNYLVVPILWLHNVCFIYWRSLLGLGRASVRIKSESLTGDILSWSQWQQEQICWLI